MTTEAEIRDAAASQDMPRMAGHTAGFRGHAALPAPRRTVRRCVCVVSVAQETATPVRHLMDIWTEASSGPLEVALPGAQGRFLRGPVFSVLLGTYSVVELLGHM